MAFRLVEIALSEENVGKIEEILEGHEVLDQKRISLSNQEILVKILIHADASEPILDLLEKKFAETIKSRVLILPVEAVWPRIDEKAEQKPRSDRIDREELYQTIQDASRCSITYLMMIFLSTVVAAFGLYTSNVSVMIGAMVIAPMLGPSMALSLGTTLGDLALMRRAFLTGLAGIVLATIFSILLGLTLPINGQGGELITQTKVNMSDLAIAFSAGCAGALAFTTGVSATLIGVMVALAVLPSLVGFGLFLGSGQFDHALSAFLLFALNIICVNLSGVVTFLLRGIRPASWWEKDRARRATCLAIAIWAALLFLWVALFLMLY